MTETTEDAFLDGRLRIRQPRRGYRAGMDPVLLAASVDARAGARVLELGCGVGVALLCLAHRVPGLKATGLELQPELADLARANAAANALEAHIVDGDVALLPPELRAQSFDHVMANPPYFERAHGSTARDAGRETGRGEGIALSLWVDAAIRRLAPGGRFWMIQRTARVPDILAACDNRIGDVMLLPLAGRQGRDPETAIISAKKGARGAVRLMSPVVLHMGDAHADGDRHSDVARSVLRDGKALGFGAVPK